MLVSFRSLTLSGVLLLSIGTRIEGFSSIITPSSFSPTSSSGGLSTLSSSSSSLSMMAGGFGGGGGGMGASSKKKKAKKETKLKPKAQWDRYAALKKESIVRVGVKIVGSDDDWLDVGRIKSKGNANTDIAVARQRAIIADHARRLFPLQVSPKDMVQWGYWKEEVAATSEDSDGDADKESTDNGEWIVVEKSVLTDAPKGIEKEIGFEGRPDPATGFYCHYSEGRLVAE